MPFAIGSIAVLGAVAVLVSARQMLVQADSGLDELERSPASSLT